jgi:long-chain acyl-CoA synthetase
VMMVLVPPVLADGVPLQRVCLPGASSSDGWLRWESLLGHPEAGFVDAAPGEEEPAVILYTSGTTGTPKGAVLTHLNLVHSVLHYRHGLGLRPRECGLLAVPGSHVTGLVALILALGGVGGNVVLLAEFNAAAALALVARERVSYTLMVPAMYALWLREPALHRADLSSLRLAGFGGAPMAGATIAGLRASCPGIRLFNAYGATETASPATMTPPGSDVLEAVGQPLPCADIRVMDDAGREVPRGTPGEVWIAGPMVVPRYWDNPRATAEGFAAGYWKSGDIGTMDAAGYLRVHDRKKDMINRGGYKVFSVEVENCLVGHPAVQEAATVGVPCPVLGERIHAFVHAPGTTDFEALQRELTARCKAELADYKTPDAWSWLAAPLPRNANGKVLKRALRERVA